MLQQIPQFALAGRNRTTCMGDRRSVRMTYYKSLMGSRKIPGSSAWPWSSSTASYQVVSTFPWGNSEHGSVLAKQQLCCRRR